MQQKINWMQFLIFGISVFQILSCDKKMKYVINAKITYINETDHNITYKKLNGETYYNEYNLKPFDTVSYRKILRGSKNSDPKKSFFNMMPDIIIYNHVLCDTLEFNEGPRNLNNYNIITIKNNDFEYLYVFTKAFAANADTCR